MSPEAEVIQLQGRLTTQTALHIGASADRELGGGRDLPILRNPLDDMPLIPGSALRGRMSSLLRAHLARGIDPPRPAAEVSALAILFGAPYRRSVLSFWDCVPETPWAYEHRAAGLPLTCGTTSSCGPGRGADGWAGITRPSSGWLYPVACRTTPAERQSPGWANKL